VEHLREVFAALRGAGISLKEIPAPRSAAAKKCHLFQEEVEYLGHIVGRGQLQVQDKNIRGLKEVSPPRCKKELRSFLGMCNVFSEVRQGLRPSGTAAGRDDRLQAARPMGDAVGRGVGVIRGTQEETHGGTHPRPTSATWGLHVGHRRERVASRGGPAARATRPIHATRGLLESLPQRGRADLQHDGAGVPRGGVSLPPPPPLH